MRYALVIAVFVGPLWSQSVSVGVLGGVQATGVFPELEGLASTAAAGRLVAGPAVAIGLSHGFGIEFNALYRRQAWSWTYSYVDFAKYSHTDNVWEFPLLGTFRIPGRAIHPYIEAGWAPRIMRGSVDWNASIFNYTTGAYTQYSTHGSTAWPTTHGLVIGGGFEMPAGPLRILPEVRYTHWNRPAINENLLPGIYAISSQNQFDIFIGVMKKVRK